MHIYYIVSQIVLEKRLSVKKIAFLCQTLQKCVNSFFIFKKKCISGLWPLMAFFKGLRFAQASKKKPFEPGKMLFFSCEKCIYCFWSVFYKKNTISVAVLLIIRVALFPKILFKIVILHNIKRHLPKTPEIIMNFPKNYSF